MVVRRQGCGGARTAGQTTTTAAPAPTPARLRPSPTPAAPRSLHHGDGRRQRLPSGRKTERTKRVLGKPRASTAQSLSPQASSWSTVTTTHESEHYCATKPYRHLTFQGPARMRISTAPVLQAPPLRYCYWLRADPTPAVINASDYRQLETKRKWLLGRCLYHRSKSFLP